MTTTFTNYRLLASDLPRSIERVAEQPVVARETQYFRDRISSVKSIDDFMADSRLYNYALKAHGLEDMAYAKAFIRKVLEEGVASPESFANRLADSRYKSLAKAFDFATLGPAATSSRAVQQGTIEKYLRQTLEENAGADDTGVRLALYFERTAATITSMYEVLADDALATVVRTALGLPVEFAMSDIDRQAEFLKERVDLAEFKSPAKLSRFIERFTALWEIENGRDISGTASLFGRGSGTGISPDLLMSINALKLGGR